MSTLNKVMLIGRLGQDPEMRYSQGGMAIATLSIATEDRKKAGDGWEKVTDWHRAIAFGRTAENAQKYISKGSQVYIEGRLKTRQWEDKQGNKRYTTEINVDKLTFLDSKPQGENSARQSNHPSNQSAPPPEDDFLPRDDEDLPF